MQKLIPFLLFIISTSIVYSQKVTIKDDDDNTLMEVTDEGITGSLLLPSSTHTPSIIDNKLYNINNTLFWHGNQLANMVEGGGWKVTGSYLTPRNLTYRVGIGLSSPGFPFEVLRTNTGDNINPIALFKTTGGNSSGAIRLQNSYNNYWNIGITKNADNAFALNYGNNISQTTDLLRLTPNGNLGLGTIAPGVRLHVSWTPTINSITPLVIFETEGTTNSASAIRIQNTSGNHFNLGMTSPVTANANSFVINYNDNIGLTSDLLTLTPEGNLGIGEREPLQKLEVTGKMKLSDDIIAPTAGVLRYNSSNDLFEGFNGSTWSSFSGGHWQKTSNDLFYTGGNVGIGGIPGGAKLHVFGSLNLESAQPAFRFFSGSTQSGYLQYTSSTLSIANSLKGNLNFHTDGGTRMTIDSLGNVGVGAFPPTQKLDISGKLKLSDDSQIPSAGVLRYNSAVNKFEGYDGSIWETLSGGDGQWTRVGNKISYMDGNVGIQDADPSYALTVGGEFAIDAFLPVIYFRDDPTPYGYISCTNYEMTIKNSRPTSTKFYTNDIARMTITDVGRVGIGTETPGNKLHVMGDAHLEDDSPRLGLYQNGSQSAYFAEILNNLYLYNNLAGDLYLATKGIKRITIDSNGYVGIGTTSPLDKLHVNGDMRIHSTEPIIRFYTPGSGYASYLQHSGEDLIFANKSTSGKIKLNINSEDVIVAKATGEVGIGVADPTYRLHVESDKQYGAYIKNNYSGVSTKYALYAESNNSASGNKYGVYGKATASSSQNSSDDIYGVRGAATADAGSTALLYGVYGVVDADGGSGSSALYGLSSGTNHFALFANGNAHFGADVRIGHTDDVIGYKVSVDGKILAEEVKVQMSEDWPDYVFEENYNLLPLPDLKFQLQTYKHLPGVPSAIEVENNGIELGHMNKVLLEKIEELTLYLIKKDEEIQDLKMRIEKLEKN